MSDEIVGGLVELLPCPFCGSEDIDSPTRYARYGRCNDCDAFGPTAAYDLDPSACVSNGIAAWNRRALSAHGQPVVDAVPPEAVEVEGTALLAGAVKLGDWAIPTRCGARIVDARMAYGWNECRKAMLEAIDALGDTT